MCARLYYHCSRGLPLMSQFCRFGMVPRRLIGLTGRHRKGNWVDVATSICIFAESEAAIVHPLHEI